MIFDPEKLDSDDDAIFGEVLFEIAAFGNFVKVSAIDPVTNTEVCIIGSPAMSPYTLKMNAMRKLKRALLKSEPEHGDPPRRPGLWA